MTDRTEVFEGSDGQWYWHRKAPNNRIIATGGEGFTTRPHADRAAERAFRTPPFPWPLLIAAFVLGLLCGLLAYAIADHDARARPATVTVPTTSIAAPTTAEAQPTVTTTATIPAVTTTSETAVEPIPAASVTLTG